MKQTFDFHNSPFLLTENLKLRNWQGPKSKTEMKHTSTFNILLFLGEILVGPDGENIQIFSGFIFTPAEDF